MGVKTSDDLKEKKLTCDICGRKFAKLQALGAHRKYAHNISSITGKVSKLVVKRSKQVKPVRLQKKKVTKPKLSKRSAPAMSPPKLRANASRIENKVPVSAEKDTASAKKTVFKCPKCVKVFNAYFSAYKHIQKNHCVDANDKPVEPNSSQLIKPIHVEPCDKCQKPKLETHSCPEPETAELAEEDKNRCMCLGCQKTFDNLELFEDHVKHIHAVAVDNLFFPNSSEFGAWKTELEASTKTKFSSRKYDRKTKQKYKIYHCSHQPWLEMSKSLLCPSYLSVMEFKNGHQVVYYKDHFGHSCSELASNKFKKYCISSYLKDIDIKNVGSDENIYEQFKAVMNNIINNSSSLDVAVLNTLLGKALEMTVVLNTSHDEPQSMSQKNMTDNQITEVLAETKNNPSRRKSDILSKNVKKNTENNESLKNSTDVPVSDTAESAAANVQRSLIQSPPSFNDTYKDFVDQAFCKQAQESTTVPNPTTVTPKKNILKKKNVVKTKIGQFKPSLTSKETATPLGKLSPKRKSSPIETPISTKKLKVINKTSGKNATSPQLLKSSHNSKTVKETPSSPKKSKPRKIIDFKIKPDIKYEVKEQENDCNILILKI